MDHRQLSVVVVVVVVVVLWFHLCCGLWQQVGGIVMLIGGLLSHCHVGHVGHVGHVECGRQQC